MKFVITKADSAHMISGTKTTIVNGKVKLKWSYANSEGFFVVAYPYFEENFNCIEYIGEILSRKDTEKGIKQVDNKILIMQVSKSMASSGIELGGKNDFKDPMKIKVIAYTMQNDEVILYDQNDRENASVIQYVIKYDKKFVRGFLGLGKSNQLIVIKSFDAFCPGLLYYTVSGNNIRYPITEKMLNKEISILVAEESMMELKVAEEFSEYFKCSIN